MSGLDVPMDSQIIYFSCRDGDIVKIRSGGSQDLDIPDNHPADASILSASSITSFPDLEDPASRS